MTGRLNPMIALAAAALLAAPALAPQATVAGQSQTTMVIPDAHAEDENDRGFGEDVSNALRDLVDDNLPAYRLVSRGDIQDEADERDVEMRDFDCATTLQLSRLVPQWTLATCIEYTSEGDNRAFSLIEFHDVNGGEKFTVDPFTIHKDSRDEAAQRIFAAFQEFVRANQTTTYCAQDFQAGDFETALQYCNEALGINPDAISTLYMKADILREMERYEEALEPIDHLLSIDQLHDDALMMGGFLATQLGQRDKGREYYSLYLDLNPGDALVRRTVAQEIAEAGNPEAGMAFLEEGFDVSDDVDLQIDYGRMAFQAAQLRSQATAVENSAGALSPEVEDLYRKAASAFEQAFAARGAELNVGFLVSVVQAYIQLGDYDEAVRSAEEFLSVHAGEIRILALMATAHRRAERGEEALAVLERIAQADPDYADASGNPIHLLQASELMRLGRVDDAIPLMREAVERGASADLVAQNLLAEANAKSLQAETPDNPYAIRILKEAKTFPVSSDAMQRLDFFLGVVSYQQLVAEQPPQGELATCAQAQRFLPRTQEALGYLQNSVPWAQANNQGTSVQQFIQGAQTYIEVFDATIRRGTGCQ